MSSAEPGTHRHNSLSEVEANLGCPQMSRAGKLVAVAAMMSPTNHEVLLPVPLRRPALVAISLAAVAFVTLAIRYADASMAGELDNRITAVTDKFGPDQRAVLRHLVLLGEPWVVGILTIILVLAGLRLHRRRLALLAVVGPLLTGVATTVVKPLDGRVIGPSADLSFPSGHTGAAAALGLVAALMLTNALSLRPSLAITTVLLGALVPGGVMAVALVASHWHYPTDTVGGLCAAISIVLGSALFIEHIAERHSLRQSTRSRSRQY